MTWRGSSSYLWKITFSINHQKWCFPAASISHYHNFKLFSFLCGAITGRSTVLCHVRLQTIKQGEDSPSGFKSKTCQSLMNLYLERLRWFTGSVKQRGTDEPHVLPGSSLSLLTTSCSCHTEAVSNWPPTRLPCPCYQPARWEHLWVRTELQQMSACTCGAVESGCSHFLYCMPISFHGWVLNLKHCLHTDRRERVRQPCRYSLLMLKSSRQVFVCFCVVTAAVFLDYYRWSYECEASWRRSDDSEWAECASNLVPPLEFFFSFVNLLSQKRILVKGQSLFFLNTWIIT